MRRVLLLVVSLALAGACAGPQKAPAPAGLAAKPSSSSSIRVSYVGNEGFLLESAGGKVLVDALYRKGVAGYPVIEPPLREKIEQGESPFQGVQLVLATHHHADHFDALAVMRHLEHDPDAQFVSTEQAVHQLEELGPGYERLRDRVHAFWPAEGAPRMLAHAGIQLRIYNMHHGRARNPPVQNLGFLVELGGKRLFHVGDTAVTPDELRALGLEGERIDVAFIPYWHFADDGWRRALVESVRPRAIVAMHLPLPDAPADYFDGPGGLDETRRRMKANLPGLVLFDAPGETKLF